MKQSIYFLLSTTRAPLEIEIPDDTDPCQRFSAALEIAVKNAANLTRADIFDILRQAEPEVPGLLAALRAGKINGSTYEGECACLCGTIANIRHVRFDTLPFVDYLRPAERWFLGISEGDTPATSQIAKITEEWILEFMAQGGFED